MFFVFSFVTINGSTGGGVTNGSGKQMTQAAAIGELPKVMAELADLDRQIAAAAKTDNSGELAGLKGARMGVVAVRDRLKARARGEVASPLDLPGEIAREIRASNPTVDMGNETLNAKARAALQNPDLMLYKIQGKAYKLSFLLVPLSLPWLWLMFAWKRDVRMYDHAVFALYSISFMSLLFVIGSVAAALGVAAGPFWFALVVAAPLSHMFAQLKGTHALSNGSAAWRTAALAVFSIITLAAFAVLMIVIGVLD